ncbi:tRNA (guanosine(37)-N1)-methyltransferase TrmD, partial [Actinomyces sp. AC-19-1]
MRLDVVTIFPGYLRVLDLSLIGKASGTGLIDLAVHDLRDWTHDRHRTVDDTPLGGGAGMVMRPDVWGEALDAVLDLPADPTAAREAATARRSAGRRQVLVVPTPAGEVLTQRTAEDLAHADQVVFACGRYEGIDARVPEHYREAGVEVRELSIGDYVLNGGEVAALVIIEAVARLRPGVLGNPDSVVEESHSETGLLEYPVHTRPVAWRGHDLATSWPGLLSGNHPRVARERRERGIARTAARRPDMVARLDAQRLDRDDRAALARNGWAVPRGAAHPVPLEVRPLLAEDVPALVALARRTFPDACPSFLTTEQVDEHMDRHLTAERMSAWQADPRVVVTLARLTEDTPTEAGPVRAGEPVGYSVVILEAADDDGALPPGL